MIGEVFGHKLSIGSLIDMKLERIEALRPHTRGRRLKSFIYVEGAHDLGDAVFVGSECGKVSVFRMSMYSSNISNVREEDLGGPVDGNAPPNAVENSVQSSIHHSASVDCMLHSKNSSLQSPTAYGLLFTGSRDRLVKVWDSNGLLIQNLSHSGPLTAIADGNDGSILTICLDGYLRLWTPQAGRSMMLNPFFECRYHISVLASSLPSVPGNSLDGGWLSCMAVNTEGKWSCYLGESDGSISVYRKPMLNRNLSAEESTIQQSQIKRHTRWEHVHSLGITSMSIMPAKSYLITMGADCTCKFVDIFTGGIIYNLSNKFKCQFTGISPMTNDQDSFLCDELGHVHKFNTTREDIVDDLLIAPANRVQKDKILNSHANPMLGNMIQFRGMDKFLIFEHPPPKRGLSERAPAPVSASHKHDVEPEGGMIGLWLPSTSITKVVDFIGHEDAIVGFGLFGQDDEPVSPGFISEQTGKKDKTGPSTEDDPETTSIKSLSSSLQDDCGENEKKKESNEELKHRLLHEADTGEDMKKLTASAHAVMKGGESYMKASKEEASFFSVSTDHTIRCWDEWDGKESYQFRSKGKSEVTTTCMLWSMNIIATGHESGMLTLWNADAGTNASSTVLKAPIMSLIESKNSRSHYLVGADFSGKIAVYNLQAYAANPSTVMVETTINSRHDKLDPSVMSLTYHALSDSYFSGGADFSVNGFRIGSETTNYFKDNGHGPLQEGVMTLKCSKNYLVSGGEAGNIILWHIIPGERTLATLSPLPTLVPMLKWFTTTPELRLPAILDFKELDNSRLFLCQTGVNVHGKYEDEIGTRVWKIWLQPRQTTSGTIMMSYDALENKARQVSVADLSAKMRQKAAALPTLASIDSSSTAPVSKMPSRRMTHSRLSVTPQSAPISLDDQPPKPGELFRVMVEKNEGMYISAQQLHYFKHGTYQINHVQMKFDETHSILQSLYFGTESGVICRHDHVIRKERGEE